MSGVYFSEVRIGGMFHMNGNDWVKQSSRTAMLMTNGRAFYFKQKEVVHLISW